MGHTLAFSRERASSSEIVEAKGRKSVVLWVDLFRGLLHEVT